MNHVYRLVWSPAQQALIAVSELTLGPGKKSLRKLSVAVMVMASAATPLAHAGPQGGEITAGAGSISQAGTTTTITQGTQNLSVNWQSFNTSSAESVKFVQPSSSAIAVNRISDVNPTQFFGQLDANGKVYLVNPNGIVFGAGSQVNVGGLVASTLDISDRSLSDPARTFSGNGAGSIVNQGTITTAQGGYVAFLGNKVDNQGTINTPGGTAALAAGSEVTLSFTGDKLVNLQVDKSTLQGLASNGGLVQADGGTVLMSAGAKDAVLASVVNNTGIVQARSVQNINGTIVLGGGADSTVSNSGTLDASGTQVGQTGGTVKVLGETVTLAAQSAIDVSGDLAGGTALVGGNFLGAGPERNAKAVTVAAGSRIKADAISQGKGGKVAVWSDGSTTFNGAISAQAGRNGGDGGSVETSGKQLSVGTAAAVTTQASKGQAGEWLLDPQDLRIGGFSPDPYDINYDQISQALANNNVTIKTGQSVSCAGVGCSAGVSGNGDIILLDGISIGSGYWTGSTTLTLSALRNIDFQGSAIIDAGGGSGNIVLRADNMATGTGTVLMGTYGSVYASSGSVKFYYNPTSYTSPTPYETLVDPGNNKLVNASNFNAYMLVNVVGSAASKTYDGTTSGVVSGLSVLGSGPSDATVDLSAATASFADKNAGANKAVTISGVTLSGPGASKYALNGLDSKTATINKATLTLTGVTANSKTYDGTTAATLSGTATGNGIIAGDAVSVVGSGAGSSFDSKNVGTAKAVTLNGYTLSGASAGNYNLVMPTGLTANVTRANLAVSGVSAQSKTYDGGTGATLSGTAAVSALGSDVVAVSGTGTGTFADKNAGSGKAVTVGGYTLVGTDAGNYNIVQPTGVTATISKANLAVSGIAVADKVYDGTTAASLAGSATVAPIGGDVVSVTGSGSASFADKNVGANKAVSVFGYALSGADAGNYQLAPSSGLTASISKADLALSGIVASDKTYDGTRAATLSGFAVVQPIGADVVSVSGSGSGQFVDKNAGTGKTVSVTGYGLSGADAGNYNLVLPSNLTANIGKTSLVVSGITAGDKTYDGGTAATLNGTASVAALGSDVVSVGGTGTAEFADKNAGSGKAVSVTGYTLVGADAGNYNAVQPSGLTATINKADITVSGLSVADKTYDGTTAATLSGSASLTPFGSDVLSLNGAASAAFSDKNAGVGKSVLVNGFTLSGADAGNYTLRQPTGLTATIAKADLALSGLAASSKTYDGTTAATLSGTASVTALGSDVVSIAGTASGNFASKQAGVGKAVSVTGYSLVGADAGNYNLVQPSNLTADIGKATLGIVGISAANKTYDGTTAANLTGTATVNAFASDVVSVGGPVTASFADKNVGAAKAVTVTGFTLSGADAGNYDVLQPSGLSASIGKADISVTGVSAANKTYDGTSAATLSGIATVSGFGSDVLSLNGTASGVFSDKNAGVGKAVLVNGYTLTGADAGNYNLLQPVALTATIDKANLALTGLSANGKTYDGTTAATLSGIASVSALGADAVSVVGNASGNFADKQAGLGKTVSVTGYSLVGADAGNYNLVQPANLTADIARATLGIVGITAVNKTYDGTAAATLNGSATVNALASDVVAVSGAGTANFADKNAGTGKAVTVSGYTLVGTDAVNYTVLQPTGLNASISKAALTVAGLSAADKVYDGSTAATLTGSASVASLGRDVVSLVGSGTGAFSDRNVGSGKSVLVSGYTLGGADAGNYDLIQPSGLTATISKANLALTGLGANSKTYDGTTAATLSGTASVSAIGADAVALSGSAAGRFADKNAGAGKAVSVSGFTLVGADAGNYTLVQPTGLSADIGKADLVVTGVTAASKTYDGTTVATLLGNASVVGLGGDVLSLSGSGTGAFSDKNAGSGKSVVVSGYALGGADAGNYNLLQPTGLSATIRQANLALTGLSANGKIYDGTTVAALSGTASVSAIGADAVALSGSATGRFADKNVGAGKAISVTGVTLVGADAGNYNLVQPANLSADIAKATLGITGIAAASKTYDGSTVATLTGTASVNGFGSDAVAVGGTGTATFADKNVGTGKAVTVSGYSLNGADATNYSLVVPSGLTAAITPASVSLAGINARSKVFDGTTTALVDASSASLTGVFTGDDVALVTAGAFADATVGAGKTVNLTSRLLGADSSNYLLTGQTVALADITAASVTVPVTTPAPVLPVVRVQTAVAQVQSSILAPQATAQPQALNLSSTLDIRDDQQVKTDQQRTEGDRKTALLNTASGFATPAPLLSIQNGGVQLPPVAARTQR
ncbi:YDG domain-containing protein [uncultured Pseudomonas sp.]|uniref:YDG domain-containing protein n=1 Tax=uncultured Pseudomonas sp. TaxID=114707 RepID=UPI0025FAC656|nr:YDG domain-containing protein [uncultured Pseudomonas sp.]